MLFRLDRNQRDPVAVTRGRRDRRAPHWHLRDRPGDTDEFGTIPLWGGPSAGRLGTLGGSAHANVSRLCERLTRTHSAAAAKNLGVLYKDGHGVPTRLSSELQHCLKYPYRDASEQRNPCDHIHAISDVTFCVRILCTDAASAPLLEKLGLSEPYVDSAMLNKITGREI